MRKTLFLTGALALVASALPAQSVRWNDRPTATWQDQAPRVKLYIEGSRSVAYGAPVAIRFQVSDNAYVTVVRVDDDGRMTILFPYSRTQRAAVRAGTLHYVRNPRLGGTMSFVSTDRMSGYVFAVASFAPLDLSQFENRDYNNLGGWSRFTMANRSIARRPDVFIDRFAAAVLWDRNTPYDYDVDYYHAAGYQGYNAFAMCAGGGFSQYVGWRTYLAQFSSWDRLAYPWAFSSMCGDMYYGLRCYSSLALYGYSSCMARRVAYQPAATPVGGQPGDSTVFVPNEGVVKGGLFGPTPVPVIPGDPDPPPVERVTGRFDEIGGAGDLSGISSIPPRATRKMKEEDARRASGGTSPSRTTFDGAAAEKTQKTGRTVADAPERIAPPSREPTKSKATGEPRRETGSKRGFGSNTGRTSEPRSGGVDRVNTGPKSSAGTGSTASPPSIQSAPTGEKKKPPQN
jgi:hypothetical protein